MPNEQYVIFIEKHIREELTVQSIAENFGYSKYHFSRMFKAEMKVSVMEYVWSRRLTIALEEILQGNRIIDVALDLGWQSHSSFSKSFKKEYGLSPSVAKLLTLSVKELGGSLMNENKEQLEKMLFHTLEENKIPYGTELKELLTLSKNVYKGRKRYSGEEYVTHPFHVAILLAQLEAEIEVIEAGLFCDVYRKVEYFLEKEINQLPAKIRTIVRGLDNDNLENASEEVLLIKAAERLHNMRTIEFMPEDKIGEKARDTINSFIPIARRLGNARLIEELNSLSIQYL